jgi:hypothetical protein
MALIALGFKGSASRHFFRCGRVYSVEIRIVELRVTTPVFHSMSAAKDLMRMRHGGCSMGTEMQKLRHNGG